MLLISPQSKSSEKNPVRGKVNTVSPTDFLEITSDLFFAVEREVHGQEGSVTVEAMLRDK